MRSRSAGDANTGCCEVTLAEENIEAPTCISSLEQFTELGAHAVLAGEDALHNGDDGLVFAGAL